MSTQLRLLIVEDSEDDTILLVRELRKGGYDVTYERVETRESMKAALAGQWDLVIADYMLPVFSGLAALKLLQESGIDLPFIIVSGHIGEDIAVNTMKAGAHDYILKGNLKRLVPAVQRELREAEVRRERRKAESALREMNENLGRLVAERTAELRENEERLERSQEIAHLGSWELDLIQDRLTWSDEVYRIFGLEPQEFGATYEAFIEAVHPDDRAMVDEAYSGSLREGRDTYEVEHRVVKRSTGEIRFVHEKCDHFRDQSGRIVRSVGMVHDITERKQAEDEREIAAGFLRLVNESRTKDQLIRAAVTFFQKESGCAATGIRLKEGDDYPYYKARGFPEEFILLENQLCAKDEEGCAIRDSAGNPVIECMCGNVILGRTDPSKPFFTAHGAFWTNSTTDLLAGTTEEDRLTRNRCNGEGYESVALIPLYSGKERLGLLQLNDCRKDLFTSEGIALWERLAGYLAVALAKFQAEEALRRAHDELEQRIIERTAELQQAHDRLMEETREREQAEEQVRHAQKMEALGTLTGGIAHDFNNILAVIIGFTDIVRGHVPKKSQDAQGLDRVMEAGLRGRELIRQMLAFSRKTDQDKKPVQLSSIIRETMKLLRASIPTTVSIKVDIKSETGVVLADLVQVQQVLMNLCTNAAYAMREKGGTLNVELSDLSVEQSSGNSHPVKPGNYARLVVRDTGEGIPEDVMDKIFDPFFTTKKLGEGTGLGLSVVHGIVRQHDGHITVESLPGKGSAFSVYLPRIAEASSSAEAAAEGAMPTGHEHILFIDDEEMLVEMGQELLEELGYRITASTDSARALALFRADPSRFDLVVTDQTMPNLTGIELAKEIIALKPDTPVILCTGFSHLVNADTARAAGIRAFAMKPLTKREIAKTIRQVLDE